MAASSTAGDALQYCTPEELACLDERFEQALQGVTCLVFWTGVGFDAARCWAMQRNLPTLSIAMGPLYDNRGSRSAGGAGSSTPVSEYMKGASIRFAEYACRDKRQAIVLTNPPPHIYSRREHSNYRDLEEPVLKGALGGCGTTLIEYVHPAVSEAATFQYQTWPHDTSNTWLTFLTALLRSKPTASNGIAQGSKKTKVKVKTDEIRAVVVLQPSAQTCVFQQAKVAEKQGTKQKKGAARPTVMVTGQKAQQRQEAEAERKSQQKQVAERKAQEKQVVERKTQQKQAAEKQRASVEQKTAEQQKKYHQRRSELEEQARQKKKAAKLRRTELEQQLAQVEKEGKQKRAELERRFAQTKKEAKQSKSGAMVSKAPVKKERKRQRAALNQQIAQQRKDHILRQVEFERQISQEREAAKRKRAELEQQIAQHKMQAKKLLAKL